jgi:hypothetical protein
MTPYSLLLQGICDLFRHVILVMLGEHRVGRKAAITTVNADPPGRFDQAAMAAVGRYRYAPFEGDGQVYERRVRLRIRFSLE